AFERNSSIGLVIGTIEGVDAGAIAPDFCLTHPVDIDEHRCLLIAALGTERDRLHNGLHRKCRRDAMSHEYLSETRRAGTYIEATGSQNRHCRLMLQFHAFHSPGHPTGRDRSCRFTLVAKPRRGAPDR